MMNLTLMLLFSWAGTTQPRIFRTLDSSVGLSQNTIWSMVQDRHGFLWLGTSHGLNRYDGIRFLNFESTQGVPDGPNDPIVRFLVLDQQGRIWIGSPRGLNLLDPDTLLFEDIPMADQDRFKNYILSMAAAPDGRIWIGAEDLQVLDPESRKVSRFMENSPFSGGAIRVVLPQDDLIWLGSSKGLFCINTKSEEIRNLNTGNSNLWHDNLRGLTFDRNGDLWIGSVGGLNRLDARSGEMERIILPTDERGGEQVNTLATGPDGLVWIGTLRSGLLSLNPDSRQWQYFRRVRGQDGEIAGDDIISIFFDSSRLLWVGSFNDGVSSTPLDPPNCFTLDIQAEGPLSHVKSMFQDRQGIIWFGTGNGVVSYNPTDGSSRRWRRGGAQRSGEDQINDLVSVDDKIWMATYSNGVNILDPQQGTFRKVNLHDPNREWTNSFFKIFTFKDQIWAGSFRGLELYRPESDDFRQIEIDGNPTNRILEIAADSSGDLWLGTEGTGAVKFNLDNHQVTRYVGPVKGTNITIPDRIDVIAEDAPGRVWLGTLLGLVCLQPNGEILFFSNENRLPGRIVFGLEPDTRGGLWMTTDAGIALCILEGNNLTVRELEVGPQHLFARGASMRTADNLIYFGSNAGAIWLNPEILNYNTHRPKVAFTSVSLFNQPQPLALLNQTSQIKLDHYNHLVLEFAALDFHAPARNRYAYMLEGLDQDWHPIGNRNWVSLNNIAPGHYRFRVKGSNNNGFWSEADRVLNIQVSPPWYLDRRFFAAAIFLSLMVAYGIHRITLVAIHNRNRALEELVAEKTSELESTRQNLLNIARRSAIFEITCSVLKQIEDQTIGVHATLEEMAGLNQKINADGLIAATRDLEQFIDGSRLEQDPEALASAFFHQEEQLREQRLVLEKKALEITNQIRHMGRTITVQHGFAREGEEEVDICALVDDALQLEKRLTLNSDITVRRDYRTRPRCRLPRIKLLHVLTQVIHNALEAMEGMETKVLGARVEEDETRVCIKIADTGRGISQDLAQKIFEEGFTTKEGHHGMGLYSCIRAMKELNGNLELGQGFSGQGTVIILNFSKTRSQQE